MKNSSIWAEIDGSSCLGGLSNRCAAPRSSLDLLYPKPVPGFHGQAAGGGSQGERCSSLADLTPTPANMREWMASPVKCPPRMPGPALQRVSWAEARSHGQSVGSPDLSHTPHSRAQHTHTTDTQTRHTNNTVLTHHTHSTDSPLTPIVQPSLDGWSGHLDRDHCSFSLEGSELASPGSVNLWPTQVEWNHGKGECRGQFDEGGRGAGGPPAVLPPAR